MQDCWGLRMPISPSNSSVRCNFRWMRRQCIVRDMSFDVGFEMAGTVAALAMLLANITGNADKADTGDSKVPPANPMAAWLDGRQHEILLRDSNGATLAPAALLRRAGTGDNSQVWMWVHPAVGTAVEVLLTHAAETAACTVARITPSLVRFRLRGPGSTSVLARALRLAVEGQSGVTPGEGTPTNVAELWQFLSGTLSSPDQLTAGVVLGAVAWDPRLKPTRGATKEHTAFAPAAPQSRVQQKKLVEVRGKEEREGEGRERRDWRIDGSC